MSRSPGELEHRWRRERGCRLMVGSSDGRTAALAAVQLEFGCQDIKTQRGGSIPASRRRIDLSESSSTASRRASERRWRRDHGIPPVAASDVLQAALGAGISVSGLQISKGWKHTCFETANRSFRIIFDDLRASKWTPLRPGICSGRQW